MIPFWMTVGRRVLQLNADELGTVREDRKYDDIVDLLILRAARKLNKTKDPT